MNFYVFYLQSMYRVTPDEMERLLKGHIDLIKVRGTEVMENNEVQLSFEDGTRQNFAGNKLER